MLRLPRCKNTVSSSRYPAGSDGATNIHRLLLNLIPTSPLVVLNHCVLRMKHTFWLTSRTRRCNVESNRLRVLTIQYVTSFEACSNKGLKCYRFKIPPSSTLLPTRKTVFKAGKSFNGTRSNNSVSVVINTFASLSV